MQLILLLPLVCIPILIALIVIATAISKRAQYPYNRSFPFECGFHMFTRSRLRFRIHYFIVAVVFLVFDIEIALLLPLPFIILSSGVFVGGFITLLVLLILIVGLYYEWNYGALC